MDEIRVTDEMLVMHEAMIHRAQNRRAFRHELQSLLNRYSMENGSDTEDFVLADYLMECLTALEKALAERKRLSGGSRR